MILKISISKKIENKMLILGGKTKISIFSIEKSIFSIEKSRFSSKIFKIIFLQEKKSFSINFFPASGDVNTSRIYAQSSMGIPYSPATQGFMKQLPVTTFSLESLSYGIRKFSCIYENLKMFRSKIPKT